MKYCFGVDIGGTTVKLGLFTTEGEIVDKWETKAREMEVRMINRKKHEINDIYVKMLRLSFFCETFMEWSEQDFLLFQKTETAH